MKLTTIYAAKILGYITSRRNALTTAGEIVEHVGISYQYCLKIMGQLKNAGLLVSEQGRNGGYQLRHGSEDVSLYDVLHLFEYHSEENGDKNIDDDPFSRFMEQLYKKEAEDLKRRTIRELYAGKNAEKKEHVSIPQRKEEKCVNYARE